MSIIDTIKLHPVLNTLDYGKYTTNLEYFLGLHKLNLTPSEKNGCYKIGLSELKAVFKDRIRQNDVKAIEILLGSNYSPLSELLEDHPFYIKKDSFLTTDFLLECINEANLFGKTDISLSMQYYIKDWLAIQLESKGSSFSSASIADALHIVSTYQAALAYRRLEADLNSDFNLTREQYDSENYETILNALEELGTHEKYFEFSATRLLSLAKNEMELGIYHGHYKAVSHLNDLFRNACARTNVTLKERSEYLESFIKRAEEKKDNNQLFILIKTLGVAANFAEAGEHAYVKDNYYENYIHFAIESLMKYAGIDDELGAQAEKELHTILQSTLNEPEIWGAHDVPFHILKIFIENKREWQDSPLYALKKLDEMIDFLRKEEDPEEIQDSACYLKSLELRREQLISLFCDREFISEDFILYLGSKHVEKLCDIGIEYDSNSMLELHSRQSLAERLIFSGKTNIHEIERGFPKATYVVANFGMIISDIPHHKEGKHNRVFKTISIKVPNYTIVGRNNERYGHAEEALYDFLLHADNLNELINQFKLQHGVNSAGHKAYGIVLDLHGTYDMCLSCSNKGLDFQNKFRELLLAVFKKHELTTLQKTPRQLPVIIRYSSDLHYDYPNEQDEKKRGTLSFVSKKGVARDLSTTEKKPENELRYHAKKDIKHYGSNLLIHGKANWHTFWCKSKRKEFSEKSLKIENWSAFASDYEYNVIKSKEEDKRINYTRLGSVETKMSFN